MNERIAAGIFTGVYYSIYIVLLILFIYYQITSKSEPIILVGGIIAFIAFGLPIYAILRNEIRLYYKNK